MVQSVNESALHTPRRWLLLAGLGLLAAGCAAAPVTGAAEPVSHAVIPAPRTLERLVGEFRLTSGTRIHSDGGAEARRIARYFAELLLRTQRIALSADERLQPARADGGIAFLLRPGPTASPEAYALEIRPGGVMVTAQDPRGLFYGAVTLWQLAAQAGDAAEPALAALRIEDSPRFRWRGLMLDSARHFQSPEFIERLIDWMALHKLNVLHWHLTDDQGWRLEIRSRPRLTEVGAWRVPAGDTRRYGGHYTQDAVRRIVRLAAERNVTIVPEIEMPGHATAALVAYPALAVDGRAPTEVPADWGIYPNLFSVEDGTFAFLEEVLGEVLELFPGDYIHVGGDEAVKEQWASSPRIQQRMRERGIADERALQSYFIQRIGAFLSAKGRRLVGWDEILEGGLAADATVMSWRGIDGALAAAAAGHDAVLSPWPTLYLDNRQGAAATEPPGRGRIVGLQDVYGFDPMPAALPADQRHHVLGLQANVWTEHIRTEERVQWMAIPRAAALAEVAWSPPERLDYGDFRRRLGVVFGWYRALGYRYADTAFLEPSPPPAHRRRSQELRTCAEKLVLNLEDDAPQTGERAVFLVDIMEPCWIFEDAELTGIGAIAATVGQFPFNFQIGKDREAIRLRPPNGADGELEVRLGGCDGLRIASLPLGTAQGHNGVTRLPVARIGPQTGRHDLCFTFTGRHIDPMWAVDSIELLAR